MVFFFYASRALAAEVKFKKALDALVANQGTQTYDLMREAINTNPFIDRYHASYSQVNLILANAIAQNEDITDQDRATIAQLIQQAIREAKAVVTLNPQRAGNWELLASTYRTIIPFAQGADQFAVQTYNQSIILDPINPNLRIALGGLHYALGDYDTAIRVFELATFAKPDHANAHYNLAVTYREKGDIQKSINEMTLVLSLVDRDSDDYELVRTELENLEKRLPTEAAEGTETLTPPQPAEAPVIQPPLELPEEAEPPATPEVSPSPSPTPTE
jgi:tetratricopeptide (TPR) repeat protein